MTVEVTIQLSDTQVRELRAWEQEFRCRTSDTPARHGADTYPRVVAQKVLTNLPPEPLKVGDKVRYWSGSCLTHDVRAVLPWRGSSMSGEVAVVLSYKDDIPWLVTLRRDLERIERIG